MKPIDLSHILEKFQGKWVALSEDKRNPEVFGSGATAKAAIREAESKGSTDYCLMYVRPLDLLFSGSFQSS